MDDHNNDNDVNIVVSDDNRNEPTEKMPWNFHDSQGGDNWGVSALQAIRELFTWYNANEPDMLDSAKCIIENRTSQELSG